MVVSAVQKTDNRSHHASYIKSAVYGGVGGYALKWALPVSQSEKDVQDSYFLDEARKQESAKFAKSNYMDSIRLSETKTPAQQEFFALYDSGKLNSATIRGYKEPLNTQIKDFVKTVNKIGREAKQLADDVVTLIVKNIRPKKAYIAAGAGFAVAAAFVCNVLNKMSDK